MATKKRESRAARRKRVMRNRIAAVCVLVVLIIVIIILIVSCSSKNSKNSQGQVVETASTQVADGADTANDETTSTADETTAADGETTAEETTATAETTAAQGENQKPVYLFEMDYDNNTCTRVSKITRAWSVDEDLVTFGAFVSTEDSFDFVSEITVHQEDWNSIETEEKYKIGYELSFDVDGEHKVITILKPADIEDNEDLFMGDYPEDGDYSEITGYMGVWLYDDVHQEEGTFYIHITQDEVTSDTVLTSIKLRPTPQSEEISNLVLKAFSYTSDDEFDEDGHYAGNYASQVSIGQ